MAKKQVKKSSKGELPRGKLALRKDLRVFSNELPNIKLPYKRVVGLDLASSAGFAFCDIIPGQLCTNGEIIGGQWDLSLSRYDTQGIRLIRLKQYLYAISPDLIMYEEVKYTGKTPPGDINVTALIARAVTGAAVVQSLCAALVTWAEELDIPTEAVPVGTLKKYATGSGNANKVAMIEACNEQMGTDFVPDTYESTGCDNIADAMFLCKMGVHNYSQGLNH